MNYIATAANKRRMKKIIEELAGSVPLASKYKRMDLDKMIEKAKNDYFRSRIQHLLV